MQVRFGLEPGYKSDSAWRVNCRETSGELVASLRNQWPEFCVLIIHTNSREEVN